jgi:pimeloyl-ACP methyl ester carboxylesterase
MPMIQLRGAQIRYEVLGQSGPWVALTPGGRRGHDEVLSIAEVVAAAGHRVLVHDRRNCGASSLLLEAPAGEAEHEVWADDQQALLEHLGAESAVIGGSSSGCRLSIAHALRHPRRVRALALLGTVAHPETPEMHQLRSEAIVLFEQGRAEEIIRANVPLAFHPDNAADPALTGAYLQMVLDAGTVRLGTLDLVCALDLSPGPGHPVTLAIRPEDVVVRNVAPGTPNSAEVRVTDIEFLGSFCRVGLAPAGNAPPLLADFSINVVRDLGISPGQSLLISLPPDRIRVFPGAPQLP